MSLLVMFDVDPTVFRSQQFLISNEKNSDDDVKVEFRSVRKSLLRFLISCSPCLNDSLSAALPITLANLLQFVIFLDFNRSVDSSQSPTLLDI
jgi:hypothetical protein